METQLINAGIGTLRFDQVSNGRSHGRPLDRRFGDWVTTTLELVHGLQRAGHKVSLLGNSIGGSVALVAASSEPSLVRCAAWVPGLGTAPLRRPGEDEFTERDERMDWEFWRQYQEADVLRCLRRLSVRTLVLLATDDQYESPQTRNAALGDHARTVTIELLQGYRHMNWTDVQTAAVVKRTTAFLVW